MVVMGQTVQKSVGVKATGIPILWISGITWAENPIM
jgi:hypothetical protein